MPDSRCRIRHLAARDGGSKSIRSASDFAQTIHELLKGAFLLVMVAVTYAHPAGVAPRIAPAHYRTRLAAYPPSHFIERIPIIQQSQSASATVFQKIGAPLQSGHSYSVSQISIEALFMQWSIRACLSHSCWHRGQSQQDKTQPARIWLNWQRCWEILCPGCNKIYTAWKPFKRMAISSDRLFRSWLSLLASCLRRPLERGKVLYYADKNGLVAIAHRAVSIR